jgi:hypothetical protein
MPIGGIDCGTVRPSLQRRRVELTNRRKKGKQQEHTFELKYGELMLQNIRLAKVEKVKSFTINVG